MSELTPVRLSDVRPLPGFRPLWPAGREAHPAPIGDAPLDAYDLGYRAGFDAASASFAEERERLTRLAASCAALSPEPSEELSMLLAEIVDRLVRATVGEVAIDGDRLLERARRAAAVVAAANDARTLHLNPADFDLIDPDALPIPIVADPNVAPGSVRIDDSAGWVEDGISVHLDALTEQLGLGVLNQ
jgi:flagellar assembly protein FliH